MESASALDAIARFYDLDLDGFDEDLAMYEGFAQRAGSPVLELGCGTGRVSAALSRADYEVTGIDISEQMLARARAAAPDAEFIHADLVSAELERQFPLVIAPLGTFLHLSPSDRRQAFANVARCLAPGGLFVVDLPLEHDWSPGVSPLVCQWTEKDPTTGSTVSKFVSAEGDIATLTQTVTYLFDEAGPDGVVRRTSATFDLGYYTLSEVRLLLEQAGLCLESVAGGYDLGPPNEHSERMIVVAINAPKDAGSDG